VVVVVVGIGVEGSDWITGSDGSTPSA
jgi:hypothetical protein